MGDILFRGDCWFSDILYYRILGDEMVNDLISREEVLKALHRNEQYAKAFGYHSVFQTVLEVPAVKQKTGKWVKMSDADGEYYCCSECGGALWTFNPLCDRFPKRVSFAKTKYCPNCGTKMEE